MPAAFSGHPPATWIAFSVLILGVLAFDLGLFHRKPRPISVREAVWTAAGYIALALCFCAWIYWHFNAEAGPEVAHRKAIQFLAGYFIEYALSMDNILVFVVILSYFRVPPQYQMRVLVWGIIGALVMRGILIFAGLALIEAFDWMVLVLGAFLIYTGYRTMKSGNEPANLEKSRIVRLVRRVMPVTTDYDGNKFFTKDSGKAFATPLFLVFIVLNVTDVLFAFDSVPAVFAVSRDPFIVYTSNVFAILGLRALYFALAGVIDKFRYLKFGLSLVLIFIGAKMIFNYPDWLPDIPTEWALAVTAILIFGSILLSVVREKPEDKSGSACPPQS
jgi:tellurite resistance protein TerC